jgi:hypothetical protein
MLEGARANAEMPTDVVDAGLLSREPPWRIGAHLYLITPDDLGSAIAETDASNQTLRASILFQRR